MTEVKEIPAKSTITVYMMMRLTETGAFIQHTPTLSTSKNLGGYWADLEEVQHEQMMQSLKNVHYRIFEINWKLN